MQAADSQFPSPRAEQSEAPAAASTPRALGLLGYSTIVVCALAVALAVKLRIHGVLACPADSAGSDSYLAYCNAGDFGDFDHGAFWFALEPEARQNAASADVLFVGSSRMQFAFSAKPTADWFVAAGLRHYLLGFSHTETVVFTGPLLADLKPRARAYVINVDRFFDDRVTPPARSILQEADARSRYKEKRFWLALHGRLCGAWPALCGNQLAFVRFRADGSWKLGGTGAVRASGVGDAPGKDREKWPRYAAIARDFVSRLPVQPNCVFLTIAPSEDTMLEEATAIADALGLPLVAPRPPGLRTFDGSHLDRPSAETWSAAFFAAAGPALAACLGRPAG